MTNASSSQIRDNVLRVQEKIENACIRAGRKVEEVTLVGVSKTQPVQAVRDLLQAGVRDIGENRVQEIIEKVPQLQDLSPRVHLIGHLQRNKAKFLPGQICMLQSLDSERTLEALEKAFAAKQEKLSVLIEINIGEESSKTGLDVAGCLALAQRVAQSEYVCLRGLMCIPPNEGAEAARGYFRKMYNLFVDMQGEKMDNNNVNILSMGMSSDYEVAIEEGATMVRVGTALFGKRV